MPAATPPTPGRTLKFVKGPKQEDAATIELTQRGKLPKPPPMPPTQTPTHTPTQTHNHTPNLVDGNEQFTNALVAHRN